MEIIISNADNTPIYAQIYAQLKSRIVSGGFSEGDLLPSIRALAKDLRISVITTKRAYDELEKDGFIHTVAGKGCYVARRNTQLIREENLKLIEEHMKQILLLADECGLSALQLKEMLSLINQEEIK